MEDILHGVGYVMTGKKLRDAIGRLAQIREEEIPAVQVDTLREAVKLLGLRNYCQVLDVAYRVMEHRTESRGNVLRSDHPETDNVDWLCMTRARLASNGTVELWDVPRPDGPDYKPVQRRRMRHPFFENRAE